MKRVKRLIALLLCILMMFPTQSIAVLGETEGRIEDNVVIETAEAEENTVEGIEDLLPSETVERIEETLPLETIEAEIESEEENLRIKETLPLQPLEEGTWKDEMVIYWNPGGVLPDNLATASDAQKATATASASSAKRGRDSADGLSPSTPVKTLAAALERAQIMQEEEGVVASDITIYAMNPMEISDGQLYILTGGQIKIVSWPGRTYDNETIFYVNGGQLTLVNTRLESGNPDTDVKEAGLVLVQGGSLQMGQNVEINGRIVMDYREEKEELVWNVATASDAAIKVETATPSDADLNEAGGEEGAFDLNDYILDSDEETLELLEDSKSASTWREPVIELLEDFYGAKKNYLLDVLGDSSIAQMELVKTLYADAESEETFMELFALSETTDSSWQLTVETQTAGRLRNTDLTDGLTVSEVLTLKTLVATPLDSGIVVHWNPGGPLKADINGKETNCPAGSDESRDGSLPTNPVKTWEKAVDIAKGGTIICMQSVNLGNENAKDYIPIQDDNTFLVSSSDSNIVNLRSWESHLQPAFVVPEGKTLVLKNVNLRGIVRDGLENDVQTVLSKKGSLILEENVTAEKGFIQVNAFTEMKDFPVKVTSISALYDGKVTLYFGGINDNLSYRYVDVVVPWGDLEESAKVSDKEAEEIGLKLNDRFQLQNSNRSSYYGGNSKFDWSLRPDTAEDGDANPQNLELYTDHYFDAVYLDGEEGGRGNDDNYGATCQYPVKTWKKATTIWKEEMEKSIIARGIAKGEGKKPDEIDELYPLPDTIYICGTVTVENTALQTWTLEKITDYDGKLITTEVVSHVDIPISEDGNNPIHELPKVLVEVASTGTLMIKDVRFRGITDERESVTIQVAEGGTLTLTGETSLTGERLADGQITAKEVTLGTHVKVKTGGIFVMDSDWIGAIERRQRGVDASGPDTIVEMKSGEIRKNNSFEQSLYDAYLTTHQNGAGVVLSDGAEFTMNGGAITENKVYQCGAGIYMTGEKTTFIMKKGKISQNKMNGPNIYDSSRLAVEGLGIGIYAGSGTVLNIGNGKTSADEVIITENIGYWASGVGIWTDGELNVNQATISLNQAGGHILENISTGIGIHISSKGRLNMIEGQVVENHSTGLYSDNDYGNTQGAGIYVAYNEDNLKTPNCISDSIISKNIIGKECNTYGKYSRGGGIFTSASLIIKNCKISYNEAQEGGGIYLSGNSYANPKLEINETEIFNNTARYFLAAENQSYGRGGGIGVRGHATLTFGGKIKIFNNAAKNAGGGLYSDYDDTSSHPTIDMRSETSNPIQIYENDSCYGGGIYAHATTIYAKNIAIINNKATSQGGGVFMSSDVTSYMKDVLIDDNKATYQGGGIYFDGTSNNSYLRDIKITNNKANHGGGCYLTVSSGSIHLTETKEGDFILKDNHAFVDGGGIYVEHCDNFIMDISGEIQNRADVQGSNLYLGESGRIQILSGNFKQPKQLQEEVHVNGIYNIYVNSSDKEYQLHEHVFDISKVKVDKNTDDNPDVIYLNTANSYLTYLTVPEYKGIEDDGTFPIDVNVDVFKVGSVVIKPAKAEEITVSIPNDDLDNTEEVLKTYDKLTNAAKNLKYSSGGKLTRRTWLGAFADHGQTNVVLLGEGVYLSGQGNDQTNKGTSPEDAVKTFAKAKELLEDNIKTASAEASNDDGFAPFIYICGQVEVTSSEEIWDLDHRAPAFNEVNYKYKRAEEELNEPVYLAQVRRFTSFVNAPMILVGDGYSEADFKTECIIIDGMADAVVTTDQKANSPVIRVMSNSIATLYGETQIMNNYYQGIEVFGSLILDGEDGQTNKQLYNHHGYYIWADSANITMQGYSRILCDSTITGIRSGNTTTAIYAKEGIGTTITMKDYSSIKNDYDIKQHDDIVNALSLSIGIHSRAQNTEVIMQNHAEIISEDTYLSTGIEILGNNSKLTMRNQARIDGGEKRRIGNGLKISGKSPQIKMCDTAEIFNTNNGVYLNSPTDCTFDMNMNDDAGDEHSAKIVNADSQCVYIKDGDRLKFSMGKEALISEAVNGGLYFDADKSNDDDVIILMQESSTISKCGYGIDLVRNNRPTKIVMKGNAAIEQNREGIREFPENGKGARRLSIEMNNDSRISGNASYGISLFGGTWNENELESYHKITLMGDAVIGGDSKFYNDTDRISGNGHSGIYAKSPINLNMKGNSKIAWNGESDTNNSKYSNGVYLERKEDFYYASGTSKISLSNGASICNNRGGIYVKSSESYFKEYPNSCEIILDAETHTSEGTPSIKNNTDSVYLGQEGILKLKGAAFLGDTTYETYYYPKRSLDCYGKLELDGRSVIEGTIYLQNPENPITMTHEVMDPIRSYHLWLAEGFIGQPVVQPDKKNMMDVTDPDQFKYFYKDGGDGMAADKSLVRQSPNIVLGGENNVYLSGNGLDTNIGNSPATAVRSFRRAKELLVEEGYFTTGANIIICNSPVGVEVDDTDWSFDPGGTVTNINSGNTWKPLVVRYKNYQGRLIAIYNSDQYASEVSFKNITIDGGSEQGIILNTGSMDALLYVDFKKKAILGEGAVLQNNKAITEFYKNESSLGVRINGGTLEIDGGIIRNMVRETSDDFSSFWFASAIYCKSYYSDTGRIIMKSGQIVENQLLCPNAYSPGSRLGTIVMAEGTELEMSGGLIANNQVISRTDDVVNSGAIMLFRSTANISGGIIRDNEGGRGSAIYYYENFYKSGSLILSGGQITGNRTIATDQNNQIQKSQGEYSPIYIAGTDFQLKGGGADVRDNIYLSANYYIIKVSDAIYQPGRKYHVFLNQGGDAKHFKKGSTVVQPDGNFISDATPYLSYFQVHSNLYILDIGRTLQPVDTIDNVTENKCLILMKAVYLDSVKGENTNTGLTPKKAVDTFSKAKEVGMLGDGHPDYYVIYISGKAVNTKDEPEWTLPETAYLCRYTGFPVYEEDGSETPEVEMSYYNFLIEPAYPLTLKQITVYGRRTIDTIESKGDSLINIKAGIQVTMEEGAVLERNYNIGAYEEDGIKNLFSEGGAIRVEAGGKLFMNAGIIQDTDAAYGSAIYLEVEKTEGSSFGHLYLTGSPNIAGKVFLDGSGSTKAAYIEPDGSYKPKEALGISIRNDYNGRTLVSYHDGTEPGYDEIDYYAFDDAVQALYDIVKRPVADPEVPTVLELNMRKVIYLDGNAGTGARDGKTPETAFGTLKQVYQDIGKHPGTNGVLVYVVNTVDISTSAIEPSDVFLSNILVKDSDGNRHYEGTYKGTDGPIEASSEKIDILGQVYFKRYAKPDGYSDKESVYNGFDIDTHKEELFSVADGGKLTLNGIYVDGHSQDSRSSAEVTLVAEGVMAESPLICVDGTGQLICYRAEDSGSGGISTATLLTNNINTNNKKNIIGKLDNSDIIEGSSAGIELLNGGTCTLQFTQFSNLSLGEKVVSGGTDVYSNGSLHISRNTFFTGTVFLEGLGTSKEKQDTSRYLTVVESGTPVQVNFQVLMRDPYNERAVVHYPYDPDVIPDSDAIGLYRLEEDIKNFFYLTNRVGKENILELQVPVSVYINGSIGRDELENRDAGSTPETPVRTLKRAFDLLRTRGGNTIYVVDTVQVPPNTYITGNSYKGNDGDVLLGSTDKVQITRYIQPDFARQDEQAAADAGYNVKDFTGVLLTVNDGITARFGTNVFFDGHSEPKTDADYPKGVIVSGNSAAKAPLIKVAKGGILELETGVTLQNNNNIYQDGDTVIENSVMAGGALYNSGTTTVNGALFTNNKANQGSGVYQDGTFTILGEPETLADHSFYLTTKKAGTFDKPVWEEDHIIQTAVMIPDGQIFDVDMDHAVKGRDVVRFTNSSAYTPNADAEHEHFKLGATVPQSLFLVEAIQDEMVLELENWELFDVEVPTDIYLVVNHKDATNAIPRLSGVRSEAAGEDLFSAPEYTIKNKGIYDVQVSVKEFINQNTEANISHAVMNLTDTSDDAIGETDLYLAVKGLDDGSDGTGFTMDETSLKPYAETDVTEAPAKLGVLKGGTNGNFTFVGRVGAGFVEKYLDPDFPIEGKSREEAQQHMDGTSEGGSIHARAKYELKYKLEMVPSRRDSSITP